MLVEAFNREKAIVNNFCDISLTTLLGRMPLSRMSRISHRRCPGSREGEASNKYDGHYGQGEELVEDL